jgi:DnaJ domain
MLSYYDLLNVDARASTAEIKKAFRERAKELHPDRNPESGREQREQFAELAEAYEVRHMGSAACAPACSSNRTQTSSTRLLRVLQRPFSDQQIQGPWSRPFIPKQRANTVSIESPRRRRCCETQAGGRSMTLQGQRLQTAPGGAFPAACTSRACQKTPSRLHSDGGGRRPVPSEQPSGASVRLHRWRTDICRAQMHGGTLAIAGR